MHILYQGFFKYYVYSPTWTNAIQRLSPKPLEDPEIHTRKPQRLACFMSPNMSKTWSGTSLEDAMNLTQATHEQHASQCEEDMERELAESPPNWISKVCVPFNFQQGYTTIYLGLKLKFFKRHSYI